MKKVIALLAILISFGALADNTQSCPECTTFSQPKGTICESWEFKIEPDMQITDKDLTKENALEALRWLKENIDKKGNLYSYGKANQLKVVQGFILKSDYIDSEPRDKEDSRKFYCKWLRDEGFWYD